MRRIAFVPLVLALLIGVAVEQTPFPSANLLGAHTASGRGCPSCHTPISGSASATAEATPPEAEGPAWGPSNPPSYGKALTFNDGRRYIEVAPEKVSTHDREVDGIVVCLSCHDGNLTSLSMMTGQSFEQRIGLMPASLYGSQPIPTLLETESVAGGNSANDHPVGAQAVIPTGEGLVWTENRFTVTPGSPYAQFVSHYGMPSLAQGRFSNPWGVNYSGEPFVLCTTCHNQHVMSVYISSTSSPIANDGGDRAYPTFFFVNGPYDNGFYNQAITVSASSTQFCRQCHFTESNEANNTYTVSTILPNR